MGSSKSRFLDGKGRREPEVGEWDLREEAIPAACLSSFPHSSKFIHFTPQLLLKQCMVGRTQTVL